MSTDTIKGRMQLLLQAIDRPGPIFIFPHDNPDPDSMASAAALRYLIHEKTERDSVIVQAGIVGRAENRAMMTYLNIETVAIADVEVGPDALLALVDTQPGRANNSVPMTITPTIVIDHHPAYAEYPGVAFLDLRSDYGATSTMLAEYIEEAHLDVDSKIATALFYGITSETQDLGREATPADVAACQYLYPYTNKRRLSKIENARVPRIYFQAFRDAIEEAQIYENIVTSVLSEVQYPDMVAEVADFLLRLDEVEWAVAMAFYDKYLYVSLRTTLRDINAGEVLRKALGAKSAGGHDMVAGGRVRVDDEGMSLEKAAVRIKDRLFKTIGVKGAKPVPLVS